MHCPQCSVMPCKGIAANELVTSTSHLLKTASGMRSWGETAPLAHLIMWNSTDLYNCIIRARKKMVNPPCVVNLTLFSRDACAAGDEMLSLQMIFIQVGCSSWLTHVRTVTEVNRTIHILGMQGLVHSGLVP